MISRKDRWTGRVLVGRVLAFAAALVWCDALRAQDSQNAAAADEEFRTGNELLATDMSAACQHFLRSMELDPNPTPLVRVAECHDREGKLRRALADYARAHELNEQLNQNRPQQQVALRNEIERRLADLDARTPKLNITVTPQPYGLELLLDGETLDPSALDAPVPVDHPGLHELVGRASGYETGEVTGSGILTLVLVPVRVPEGTPVGASPRSSPSPVLAAPSAHGESASQRAAAPGDPGKARRTAGYIVGASGLGVLGVAAYFGVRTLALVNDADPYCDSGGCDEPGYGWLVEATHAQTTGFILAGTGAALLTVGAVLVLTASPHRSSTSSVGVARMEVTVGPLGVAARGAW